ncbi:MAG TPA: lipoyl(octanoyl) transferase LipB [Marine Group III euryarchaeote]|uniref:Octanoyltransferase n=1 Tax=Marine Group III euryarchaeote TaxID=2173149 RepID=A0A7J4CZD2_9ARCH|nr:lipoyl(octanoyl) transferase LipB [Marine Group III euryarchaeote]
MISVDLIEAGNAVHSDVDRLMIGLQEQRIDDKIPDTLIFVEHPEIVTIGRRGMLDGLEAPDGFASSNVDRGGGITWHGPGQLVGYPVFKWQEESIRKVITMIEEWIIISLDKLGIKAVRNEAMQGVWYEDQKIASIGLAFSKWVSRHGFDINLTTPPGRIESVEGCGLPLGKHTSLSSFGFQVSIQEMQDKLVETMPLVLGREINQIRKF